MIIKKLEIISFGKFTDRVIDFSDGLNIISGNNESGKSTIIAFIYSMLYGFGDNRGKTLSFREKYTPWDGGVCEGKMTVSTDDGETFCIYRKAGNAKKYDILRVYNAVTGEESQKSPEDIIGIGEDTFFKTICIKQLSTPINGGNEEIIQKLSNITSGGDETVDFEKAIKILENIRREIQPHRGQGGRLSIIANKIADAEKAQHKKNSVKAELGSVDALLPCLESEISELKKEAQNSSVSEYSHEIARLRGRIDEMHRQSSGKTKLPLIYGGIFSLILFMISLLFGFSYGYLFLSVSLVLFAVFFTKRNSSADEDIKKAEEEILKLTHKKNAAEKNSAAVSDALSDAEKKLDNLKVRKEALTLTLAEEIEDPSSLFAEKKKLEETLQRVTLCTEALNRAYENMQKNFTPRLNKNASHYFSHISGGKYSTIYCDKEFGIRIENGLPRESSFFSGGTVDQLYLSLRLALIDMLFGRSACPIILDQPFLQYDRLRKERAINLLENLPVGRQVLLFTSDENINSLNKATEILT